MKKEIYIGLFALASLMMLPVGLVAQGEAHLTKAELEKVYKEGKFQGEVPYSNMMPFICFVAYKGNVQVLDELLKSNEDVNTATSDGKPVLMYALAAEGGPNMDEVRLILNQPAVKINVQDSYGQTPLILAAIIPNLEAVKALVEGGANMDLKAHNGTTALSAAQRQLGYIQEILKDKSKMAEFNKTEDDLKKQSKQFEDVIAYLQQAQKAQPIKNTEL